MLTAKSVPVALFTLSLAAIGCVRDEPAQPQYGYQPQPGQPGYPQQGYPQQPGYRSSRVTRSSSSPIRSSPTPTAGQPAPVPDDARARWHHACAREHLAVPVPVPVPGCRRHWRHGGTGGTGGAPASGAAAQPIDPNVAGIAVIPLNAMAQSDAPGAKAEGPVMAGNFQEGQVLEQQVQLLPQKCYTVLSVGTGTITEMDLQLVLLTPVPGLQGALAQDTGTGGRAGLGAKGNCYKWQAPSASPPRWS